MTEKPIMFSGPMVRAILEGRKTMTRRVLKQQPFPVGGLFYRPSPMVAPREWHSVSKAGNIVNIQKLPYAEGAELWVREAWRTERSYDNVPPSRTSRADSFLYEADGYARISEFRDANAPFGKLRPRMFMPRWASRITLRVTGVKVERLQDISEEDAMAEGLPCAPRSAFNFSTGRFCPGFKYQDGSFSNLPGAYRRAWMELWNSINGTGAWEANPWVAAYTFEVVSVAGRDAQ